MEITRNTTVTAVVRAVELNFARTLLGRGVYVEWSMLAHVNTPAGVHHRRWLSLRGERLMIALEKLESFERLRIDPVLGWVEATLIASVETPRDMPLQLFRDRDLAERLLCQHARHAEINSRSIHVH